METTWLDGRSYSIEAGSNLDRRPPQPGPDKVEQPGPDKVEQSGPEKVEQPGAEKVDLPGGTKVDQDSAREDYWDLVLD